MYENVLDLVCLFNLKADADGVDGRLDQDTLVLVASNRQWREENLRGGLGFNLGDIVAFGCLRRKVGQGLWISNSGREREVVLRAPQSDCFVRFGGTAAGIGTER